MASGAQPTLGDFHSISITDPRFPVGASIAYTTGKAAYCSPHHRLILGSGSLNVHIRDGGRLDQSIGMTTADCSYKRTDLIASPAIPITNPFGAMLFLAPIKPRNMF